MCVCVAHMSDHHLHMLPYHRVFVTGGGGVMLFVCLFAVESYRRHHQKTLACQNWEISSGKASLLVVCVSVCMFWRACVRACVHVCVHACVHASVHASVCVHACVCMCDWIHVVVCSKCQSVVMHNIAR